MSDVDLNRRLFLATTDKRCHECAKSKYNMKVELSMKYCWKDKRYITGCDRLTKLLTIIKNHEARQKLTTTLRKTGNTIGYIIEEVNKRQLRINRPVRDKIINDDDLTNLEIAFNTSKGLTDFCNKI